MTAIAITGTLALGAVDTAEPATSWATLDRDLHSAIRYSATTWGTSYARLHACAHSEGGHGRFVWNRQGSGAGGWFQFMRGTFDWMSNAAWKEARKRNLKRPPLVYKRYDSKLGQAFTAAWAFSRGLSYHWVGRGCRR